MTKPSDMDYGNNMNITATSPLRDEPQQWVRVPVEPTPEMVLAISQDNYLMPNEPEHLEASRNCYRLILAAAPKDSKHIERAMELAHQWVIQTHNKGLGKQLAVDEARAALKTYLEGGGSE